MPEIDPNNTGETPAAREALEQRKLALEIAELGKPLWRKAGFYAVVGPTMLGITTLGIGFQTGYFDTATERLDAEKVLLKIEEYKLIEEIDQIKDTLKKQSDDFDRNQETIKAELDQQRQNLKKEKVALRAKFESDTKTMLAKFEEEKRRLQASIKLSEYELAALEKAREDLEHSLIEEITRLTPILQDSRAVLQDGAVLRGFHPKSHGCVSAKFIVNQDIEERFQVGLFASPGKIFDARVRFSNASVRREHDLKNGMNDSRGMAIKVVDVEGDMLSEDDGQSNQDFLMINTPAFPFRVRPGSL